jgi:hypothetical protein
MTDFDRFKLFKAKQARNRLITREMGILKSAGKKGDKKGGAPAKPAAKAAAAKKPVAAKK